MFKKKNRNNMILSLKNVEVVENIEPDIWFKNEWKASCRKACTTFRVAEDLAAKAKNAKFSKQDIFDRLKRDHCQYSSDKSIWAAIYKGWGDKAKVKK